MKKSWLLLTILVALPIATHAEIYKWKDKDGAVRYSDVPPASNIPHETLRGKNAAPSPAATPATPSPAAPNPDEAAVNRQQSAEQEKARQQAKDNEQEVKKQNCMNAQTNLQKFKVGGRIMKVNEKGERAYLSDAEIKQGLDQAQKEIEQFCTE